MTSHYQEKDEAIPVNATCMICEGVTGTGHRGNLVAVRATADNSGRMNYVHERCREFSPRQSSSENIWAFAAKFKYYTAASGTDGMSPTVQETFPKVEVPKVEPAIQTDVEQQTKDGAPVPPKPF